MRRGEPRGITVDGQMIQAEYLGKGRHCTAYRAGDTVYCFVVEDEYMKDCVAESCPEGPHIPAIKKHDDVQARGEWRKVYSMPFYRDVTARDKEAWATLKTLKKAADRIFLERYCHKERDLPRWGNYFGRDVIEATRGQVPESVTEALENLIDAAGNYGIGVTFEFGKRNIGVDDQGRIVFRDILFDAEKIERELMQRRKQHAFR